MTCASTSRPRSRCSRPRSASARPTTSPTSRPARTSPASRSWSCRTPPSRPAACTSRSSRRRIVDQGTTLAEKFLIRWKGEADPKHVKAIDAYWSSAAEHGMNASTFTARVITSTGADVAAAFSGAIGAMSGPLHGGAPARVLTMIEEVEKSGDATAYVKEPARLRRAADGLRPPRLPRRGPARPRAAAYGQGAQRTALRRRRGARAGRAQPSCASVVPTACSRPTSSSGPRSCSTSPRCRPTCSPRCSPAPARVAGRRTSWSRSAPVA